MVAALLTVLTLSVLQLGLALHIRNTLLDAAAEGARVAALADGTLADGVRRTEDLLSTALGPSYARGVSARQREVLGAPGIQVTVIAPVPLIGLIGFEDGLEVSGHAALDSIR